MSQDLLKKVEKKTGIDKQSIAKVASSFNGKNLQDEKTARTLVRQVGKLAGKKVPRETEDMIVKMLSNGKAINENTINKMMK
ncbi:stage VI sporulation protein F [Aquibacillus rhizosphaerae]|uniref:Stage VI sporulation protein F n=1 Tax=Aquibacillus rhizosphaerae TaxID=3051431 RepID=A0ABT7LD95_9BACI|nr:stage VI sporulation protein F [Aquibacillus sp. LR5S19]MDL4843232.1 stage VI sporulation protein F [Aquibacillus sp. LR5S19]